MNFKHQLHKLRLETRHVLPKTVRMVLGFCALMIFQNAGAVLNDTGITQCGDLTGYSISLCGPAVSGDAGTFPRQDAAVGRDAIAAPNKGFDFTKIANNGSVLPSTAALGTGPTDWACTRDNVTNLVWEVKTSAGDLRSATYTYSWYSSTANGGGTPLGTVSAGACLTPGRCDTEKYVTDVNAATLCGATNWRLPNFSELHGIMDFGSIAPAIDLNYFPNTATNTYWWTGNINANTGADAWAVNSTTGGSYRFAVSTSVYNVRVVRSGP